MPGQGSAVILCMNTFEPHQAMPSTSLENPMPEQHFARLTHHATATITRRRALMTAGGAALATAVGGPVTTEAGKAGENAKRKVKKTCQRQAAACRQTWNDRCATDVECEAANLQRILACCAPLADCRAGAALDCLLADFSWDRDRSRAARGPCRSAGRGRQGERDGHSIDPDHRQTRRGRALPPGIARRVRRRHAGGGRPSHTAGVDGQEIEAGRLAGSKSARARQRWPRSARERPRASRNRAGWRSFPAARHSRGARRVISTPA